MASPLHQQECHARDVHPPEFLDILLETASTRDRSPSEGRFLASRAPTPTESSAPCDANTTFVERKIYKWRTWATESV